MRQRPTIVRHIVLWLTVLVYMITYMDRGVLSTAQVTIQKEFGFSRETMGDIISAFRFAYAIFQIPGGWLGDKFGPRVILASIVAWWSLFTGLTAVAWSARSMMSIRFVFGMGEAGAFATATRSLSRWMLPKERGWAQGVTHAGSRLGLAITPAIVAPIIAAYGWRAPFWMFSGLGLLWAAVWYWYYRDTPEEHRGVNDAERELIHAAAGGARTKVGTAVPWKKILSCPTIWLLSGMYACYQWSLGVYTDWFPTYLQEARHFSLKQMGIYASLPLAAGMIGNLLGGWLSDRLLQQTGNVKLARRAVGIAGFVIAGLAAVPAVLTTDPFMCVIYNCFAFGGAELTIGASWAVPLDIAGDFAGSAASVMNMVGNLCTAISPLVISRLVTASGWNGPFFITAGFCVLGVLFYSRIDASKRIL